MAQAIHCDGEDHRDALADVLVTHLENGETSAWCFDHYVEVCRAVVETVEAAQREATDQEALARLEAIRPRLASTDQEDQATADVLAAEDVVPAQRGDGGDQGEPVADTAGSMRTPDPGVGTFREAGDQPVQEGVGGPETGEAAQSGPATAPEPVAAPEPPQAVRGRSRETSPPG